MFPDRQYHSDILTAALVLDSIAFEVKRRSIIRGAWLRVPKGRIVGLVGRNGCGKSTLLRIAAGDAIPSHGNVFIDGVPLENSQRVSRFKRISYLSQTRFAPGDLTVRNLASAFAGNREWIEEDRVLSSLADSKVKNLSTGNRRYLEVRLVLCLCREFALLDEPFTGLQPKYIEHISSLLVEQARSGKGILLTDHYHQFVIPLLDECYVLHDGYAEKLKGTNGTFRDELVKEGYFGCTGRATDKKPE